MAQPNTARAETREHPRADFSAGRAAASLLALAGVVSILFAVSASATPAAGRQDAGAAAVRPAQVLERDRTGVTSPAGLAFSPGSDSLYVVESHAAAAPTGTDVVTVTPFVASQGSDRVRSATRIAAAVKDPVNMAFDARGNRLLLLDAADRLLEVRVGADGELDPSTLARRDALRLDLGDAQGMAVDPTSGVVYVLDADPLRLVRIVPDGGGGFDTPTRSELDLGGRGLAGLRGLAFDPLTGNLHVGGREKLVELSATGEVLASRDLSAAGLANPQGMVFAPSGDRTDAPGESSVYVADSGPAKGSGQIVELSLTPLASVQSGPFTPTVVNTVDLATLSPPSPDPSGIAYLPGGTLLVSDAEVEETVDGITHFQGANLWELSPAGGLVRTSNVSKVAPTPVPMTDEPTGVAFQPGTGHYFFAEDSGRKVYELNPGADGLVGTVGDTWTSFSTGAVGNTDPEGIAYDSFADRLFVADGLNREIYEYTTSGTYVGQFDTLAHGVEDPESVEFNAISGTLFVLSNHASGPVIIETTTSGDLVQTLDISAAGLQKPAGLAYAPASDGSGDMHFYIVDRGIDNNQDPTIVDGRMLELTAPPPTPPANAPPIVDAGDDHVTTVSAPVALEGAVSDDGLPSPPGLLTTTWTAQSGPGTVGFGDVDAVETSATFSLPGTYVLRLAADDSAFTAFDELSVVVGPDDPGSPLYFSLRDAATVGGVAAANEDIVFFDGASFSLFFDGSDVGIASLRIDAFARIDADSLLLSFDADKPVPGIAGTVDDSDVVRFETTSLGGLTAGTFSMYFDGSDVGLTASGHDVNVVEPLADGRIILSTLNSATVSGASGSVSARDEDLLAFTPISLGDVTAGTFELYFDGSDVGLGDAGEEVDAAAVGLDGRIYLSALDVFSVPGVSGGDEDVFVFTPTSLGSTTSGTYSSTLFFDGSSFGLDANDVFAIDLP